MKRSTFFIGAMIFAALSAGASGKGGISPDMLGRLKSAQDRSVSTRALRNAISTNDIDKIASNPDSKNGFKPATLRTLLAVHRAERIALANHGTARYA